MIAELYYVTYVRLLVHCGDLRDLMGVLRSNVQSNIDSLAECTT